MHIFTARKLVRLFHQLGRGEPIGGGWPMLLDIGCNAHFFWWDATLDCAKCNCIAFRKNRLLGLFGLFGLLGLLGLLGLSGLLGLLNLTTGCASMRSH